MMIDCLFYANERIVKLLDEYLKYGKVSKRGNTMTSYKIRPYLSLIGFCILIFTLLVNFAFRLAKDPGSKMWVVRRR